MNGNQQTVQSYNKHVQQYIDGTPQEVSGDAKAWIDQNLAQLAKTAKILELGSAFGRDADYMESQGFTVERTDVTPAFIDYLKEHGHTARVLDVLSDPIGIGFDMIFANAVLLHLTRDEAKDAIRKIFAALAPGGRFVFSLKMGDGEGWSEEKLGAPRYFCYWQQDNIEPVLRSAGFSEVSCYTGDDYQGRQLKWLFMTATKGAQHEQY